MASIEELQKTLDDIQARNRRVEAHKAWEVSFTRRAFIAAMTYVIASIWLVFIEESQPFFKALVPFLGYVLSTFSLPPLKHWWIRKRL